MLGQQLVAAVPPEAGRSAVSAIDGRMYEAHGPKWHRRDRPAGLVPGGWRNVDTESQWSRSGYRGWIQGYRLVVQGLAFPVPVPVFAAWRPNNEYEADMAIEALLAGDLKVTDVLLGDETYGGGLSPYLYEEVGGWVLSPKQLLPARRSWKDDLYDSRKETIELLFTTHHSSIRPQAVPGQRRRPQRRVRPSQCLAVPGLLPLEVWHADEAVEDAWQVLRGDAAPGVRD